MKIKTSTVVLIILAIFILIFTGVCIWLFYLYQAVPDVLIQSVYGAAFGEAGVLGWIKITKTKFKKDGD